MRTLLLSLLLIGAVPAAEKPNVLIIAVDDLNDWIGPLRGHPQARTPHLDRLAARGVVFTHAYCAAPACNPSEADPIRTMWWISAAAAGVGLVSFGAAVLLWPRSSTHARLALHPTIAGMNLRGELP